MGFIFEILFFTICGWVGHVVIKLLTFGKVDFEWGRESGGALTETIGLLIFVFTTGLVVWVIRD